MSNISGFSSVNLNSMYNNKNGTKTNNTPSDTNSHLNKDIFTSSGIKIDPVDPHAPIQSTLSTIHSEEFTNAYRESNKNFTNLDDYAKSLFDAELESTDPEIENDDFPKDEEGRYVLSEKDREKLEDIYDKTDAIISARLMLEHGSADAKRYAEYVSEEAKRKAKVQSIASSIASGKQVPSADEAWLLEKASAIYQMAIMQRTMKEKADEKVDSVLDDEDRNKANSIQGNDSAYEGMQDVPEDQLPEDVKLLRAIGDVLVGDKHLSSLEGLVDISRYDGVKISASTSSSVNMPSINISI